MCKEERKIYTDDLYVCPPISSTAIFKSRPTGRQLWSNYRGRCLDTTQLRRRGESGSQVAPSGRRRMYTSHWSILCPGQHHVFQSGWQLRKIGQGQVVDAGGERRNCFGRLHRQFYKRKYCGPAKKISLASMQDFSNTIFLQFLSKQDRKLNFSVAYIQSATRQRIELRATSRYATMNDFVIEHPDGLATYRVYDKKARCQGNMNAFHSDSIDVAMGMGQQRGLWRSFVRLGQQIDKNEGWEENELIAECKELTDVALQMKKILIALMESLENGGAEVAVEGIEERCCPP